MAHTRPRGLPALGSLLAIGALGVACESPVDLDEGRDAAPDGMAGASGGTSLTDCTTSDFGGVISAAPKGQFCTAVLALLPTGPSQAVTCGPTASVTLESARAAAEAGFDNGGAYLAHAPDALPEAYVFFHDPMDFGGLALVSKNTGLLAVRVKTSWSLDGQITKAAPSYPSAASWSRPASCVSQASLPPAKGLYLDGGQIPTVSGLDGVSLAGAVSALTKTPIADELASRAPLTYVLVLESAYTLTLLVLEAGPLE